MYSLHYLYSNTRVTWSSALSGHPSSPGTQRMSCRKIKASPPQAPARAHTELDVSLAPEIAGKTMGKLYMGKPWEILGKCRKIEQKHRIIRGKCGKHGRIVGTSIIDRGFHGKNHTRNPLSPSPTSRCAGEKTAAAPLG